MIRKLLELLVLPRLIAYVSGKIFGKRGGQDGDRRR